MQKYMSRHVTICRTNLYERWSRDGPYTLHNTSVLLIRREFRLNSLDSTTTLSILALGLQHYSRISI